MAARMQEGVRIVRRLAARRLSTGVLVMAWSLLATGAVTARSTSNGFDILGMLIVTVGLVAAAIVEVSHPRSEPRSDSARRELEQGLLVVTGVFFVLILTGGQRSLLYPLAYAVVSCLMVVHPRAGVATALLAAAVLLESLLAARASDPRRYTLWAYHVAFFGFFAIGHLLVLRAFVRRLRSSHTEKVAAALGRIRQEAREFRLVATGSASDGQGGRDDAVLRRLHGAVESIHDQLAHTLGLLRRALGLHGCALLWCEEPGSSRWREALVVKALATAGDAGVAEGTVVPVGMLTSVFTDPKALRLEALGGRRVPPYYRGHVPISDLCAIPLFDKAALCGILVADRGENRAFSDADEGVLRDAAGHITRVVEHERVFSIVERRKYEQEQFYRASELLNEALTVEQVCSKTFEAVRAIVQYDVAAISTIDAEQEAHCVLAVDPAQHDMGPWAEVAAHLKGMRLAEPASLVSMAVKNRHYMPASGEVTHDAVVFSGDVRLKAARSALVLPLCRGDTVLGAITLASGRDHQFGPAVREMLRVISHQVAVSLQNARLYRSMEERATTDGLTGLTNHRAFQERLGHLHALAERTGQTYAIILTDIDHFKNINDSYGHPVGDQVLKRVAGVLARAARKVDIVARYGGEEFVLVLPDTDGVGAETFANRLREEIGGQVMTAESGRFKVTISMGVSEFPVDGNERMTLIERADQALYRCKTGGRNLVCRYNRSVTSVGAAGTS